MFVLLLAFQAAPAAGCAPAALCRTLESAAAANQAAMMAPGGYSATVETETATLGRREGRIEGATLIEQTSGVARWSNDGGFEQHVTGSRSFPNAIPLSRLSFMRIGWVVPTLIGQRLQVIARSGPGETRFSETLRGPLAPEIVVHPLASDRYDYYRLSGGDPVVRMIDGVGREVIAVTVAPLPAAEGGALFEGEMDLDARSLGLVRLLGRIRTTGPRRSRGMFNLVPAATLVDLVSQRLRDGAWVPLYQRFELQTVSSLASGYGAVRRVISRFYDATPLPASSGSIAIGASTTGYVLTSAPGDSLRGFRAWHAPAGRVTRAAAEADFSNFRPQRLQPTGRPELLVQGIQSGDFLRINRIEGLFTGISLIERFRDAAPGLSLRGTGGYAWSEKPGRGAGAVGWQGGRWSLEGSGARSLDVTNKFRNQFDNPAFGGMAGRDPWDYVNRTSGGISVTRLVGTEPGSIVQVEAARVRDDSVVRHMERSVFGGRLRVNRNITEGSYWRTRVLLDWNPTVSPLFAHDGVGVRAELENGSGDLDYTRVEGRIVLRKSLRRFFFIARLHGGAVFSTTPPPQQLFELGGPAGLPGYEYKEFAGDRALLFRTRLTYPLAALDAPIRISRAVTLPSLAPAISVGFQGGFTDTRTAGGRAAVRALGDRRDDATGELVLDPVTGLALPAAVATDQLRTSLDIRIGFFGDALAVGFARALESGRKTRFIFAFGRQF